MAGILYIVATPIGNLEDITLRALKVLEEVDVILAEDTRQTSILMKYFDIQRDTLSYHQHSGEEKKLEILNLLISGKNLGLVTDAGTPGISDPGNELIDYILSYDSEIKVVPIPGATAITTGLSVCGFDVNKFVFLGFLPKKKKNKLFAWLKNGGISFAFYESPNRILKTLDLIGEVFGDYRRIFVGRELTKLHETLYRGSVKKVKELLSQEMIRGEIVTVVEL